MPAGELTAAHAWLGGGLLHAADLFRLLRLFGHGDRARPHVRLPLPGELQLPVHRAVGAGILAALAHVAVARGSATTSTSRSAATGASTGRLYFNWCIVFFLCGLWHGASWTFVIWGLFHGLFLVLERLGLGARAGAAPRADPACVPAARGDDRLGVLPRRHAVRRRCDPRGDGRIRRRRADAYSARVVPDAGASSSRSLPAVVGSTPIVSLCARWRDRVAAASPAAARPGTRPASCALVVVLIGVDRAVGRWHLQPVHLLPLLMQVQVEATGVSRPRSRRMDVALVALFLAIIVAPGLGLVLGARSHRRVRSGDAAADRHSRSGRGSVPRWPPGRIASSIISTIASPSATR